MAVILSFFLLILPQWGTCFQFDCYNPHWIRQPRVYLNQREILAPTAHNFPILLDSTDSVISERILTTGTWEPQLIYLISQLVRPGFTMLNIGAQLGLEAVLMGLLSEGGKVYAFEPYSVSYRMLVKSVYINDLASRVICYRLAAGARSEQLRLKIDTTNTGHSHIFYGGTSGQEQLEVVKVERVDTVLPGSARVDFGLIDVEMQEVEVLLGMRQVLRRSGSAVLLVQWGYMSSAYRSEEQVSKLISMLQELRFVWVRYKDGQRCKLGSFQLIQMRQLLDITVEDLLLVGPDVDLQRLFGIHL